MLPVLCLLLLETLLAQLTPLLLCQSLARVVVYPYLSLYGSPLVNGTVS